MCPEILPDNYLDLSQEIIKWLSMNIKRNHLGIDVP